MRILPPPWAGTHPAFPRTPEPLSATRSVNSATTLGSLLGTAWASGRFVLGRRYPGMWLNAIGSCTLATSVLFGFTEYTAQSTLSSDINTLLKQDNIPVPSRKLYETTTQQCGDDYALFGATLGLTAAILGSVATRRAPAAYNAAIKFGWKRAVGGVSSGFAFGLAIFQATHTQQLQDARIRRREEAAIGAKIWVQKLGKPPPAWLYNPELDEILDVNVSVQPSGVMGSPFFHTSAAEEDELGDEMGLHPRVVVQQPPGSRPHTCVIVDGKIQYAPGNRDYFWEPASPAEGLETLQDHIDELKAERARLHREAEFLYYEIAARESQYATRDKSLDGEASRKRRKALELLNSLHHNQWVEISVMDWLITDSQKMVLQLKTNGTWMPEKSGQSDPVARVPDGVMQKLRQHKKKTTMLLDQLETAIVPSEAQQQMEDNIREVRENDAATEELVEELEERKG
jgi:hypothetical protein